MGIFTGASGFGSFAAFCFLHIFLTSLSANPAADKDNQVVFGRYSGVLHHERLKKDQLATLDLIASRNDGNSLSLVAVLKLHFGDYASAEYISYHFDKVNYQFLTGQLTFEQADQAVSVFPLKFDANTGEFVGKVRAMWSPDDVGELELSRDRTVTPKYPLMQPIWGEYRGVCKRRETILQLYTFRATGTISPAGNPFGDYEVRGQLGERDRGETGTTGGQVFGWDSVSGATYDFYNDDLRVTSYRSFQCSVQPDGLNCNDCSLKRVSYETKGSLNRGMFPFAKIKEGATLPTFYEQPPKAAPAFLPPPSSTLTNKEFGGGYVGYIHHEYLDRYQLASLNLGVIQTGKAGADNVQVSARAVVYFGDMKKGDSIAYPFELQPLSAFLASPALVVFKNTPMDVDAIMQITSVADGVFRGVWYSQIFGRVGTFEFRKNGLPKLPENAKFMEQVGDTSYEGKDWNLNLVVRNAGAPLNNDNPFAPNIFQGGQFYLRDLEAPARSLIAAGSYDFYTGRFGLERRKENGMGVNMIIGQRLSRDWMWMNLTQQGMMLKFQSHEPRMFRRIPFDN